MATEVARESIEERLAAVESSVARILQRLEKREPATGWLKQFRGCMANEPGFSDLVRYGREFRQSDRPLDDDESQS
jgi:hypothetical protein